MNIIILNGFPGSGKSTFAELVIKNSQPHTVFNISTVDKVKKIAKMCGWNGEKTLEARRFLSDLKDITTQYNNMPLNDIIDTIGDLKYEYGNQITVFIHCREPQEIDKIVNYYDKTDDVYTLIVRRPDVETNETSNHADANVYNYFYKLVIMNEGTLENLEGIARQFIVEVLGKEVYNVN